MLANPDDIEDIVITGFRKTGPRQELQIPLSALVRGDVHVGVEKGNLTAVIDGLHEAFQTREKSNDEALLEMSRKIDTLLQVVESLSEKNTVLEQQVAAYRAEVDQIEIPVIEVDR